MKKLMKAVKKVFNLHRGEKGFTLIELLVVVGILGILAGVVTLNLGGFIGTGQSQAAATERHNVQTAVTAYSAAHGGAVPASFPADLDPYLVGGSAALHGTYTMGADGEVTQTAYP
jgi:prepilin-type N-terminal cleavage/methylation domain-containing protein